MMRLLGVLAALVWLVPAGAQAACKGRDLLQALRANDPVAHGQLLARADRVPNSRGVFWRISKPGVAPSHLYGTMHLDGLEDTVPDAAWKALDAARITLFEMTRETTDALVDDIRSGRVPDRDRRRPRFESFMAPADAARLRRAFAEQGADPQNAHQFVPWKAIAILESPPCHNVSDKTPVLDEVFENRALKAGKRRIGLDNGRQILLSDNRLPVAVFRDYLLVAARTADDGLDAFVTGMRVYRAGQPALYFEFFTWFSARAAPEVNMVRLWKALVTDDLANRNAAWMPVLERELKRGNAFVVVGAGHLPYQFGLIEQLRARGFTVTRLN